MKRIILLFLFGLLLSTGIAQVPDATYEMKTDNFKQLDESTISWELWMRKASGDDFGLFGWELHWEFDNSILNSGEFNNAEFTIAAGADGIYANHYDNANATVPNGVYFKYNPGAGVPDVGENSTLITGDWKHIATFSAQLTKEGSPHNFASADISFAHRTNGVVQVFATTNPHQTGNNGQITGTIIVQLQLVGIPIPVTEQHNFLFWL